MSKQQIGVVGMAVMGKNLALNIESRGYSVALFNRTGAKTTAVVEEHPDKNFKATYTIEEFVESIEKPRRILLMVKAGPATDATIQELLPHLDKGDILIDGGNTFFKDTMRRNEELANSGINFIGTGVSGGEEGALKDLQSCLVDKRSLCASCTNLRANFCKSRRRSTMCHIYWPKWSRTLCENGTQRY